MIVTATFVGRTCEAFLDWLQANRGRAPSEAAATDPAQIQAPTADESDDGEGVAAHVRAGGEAAPWREFERPPQPSEPKEAEGASSKAPACNEFRIQFLGGATGEGPDVIEEASVRAPNVFDAFRAAEHNPWPPGATGLRILDSRGRDIFWRRRPGTDNGYEFHLHLSSDNSS